MPDALPIDLGRYSVFSPPDPFEEHVGPFYFRIAGDARQPGDVHCVLPTLARHGNYAGAIHGGATLAFADYALCLVAGRAADGGANTSFAMTVSIAVEFLDAGRIGPPLEARGEPLQVTGRLAFARGSITQEGRTVALWSGVCRHVARAKVMGRKEASSPSTATSAVPQSVPVGFEPSSMPAFIPVTSARPTRDRRRTVFRSSSRPCRTCATRAACCMAAT